MMPSTLVPTPHSELRSPHCFVAAIGRVPVHFPEPDGTYRMLAACPSFPATEFETWEAARDKALERGIDPEILTIRRA